MMNHLIITHENYKAVTLMSLNDFNAWQETEYLMRSPANAQDLLQAVQDLIRVKIYLKRC
jgi:antitoxin YefM